MVRGRKDDWVRWQWGKMVKGKMGRRRDGKGRNGKISWAKWEWANWEDTIIECHENKDNAVDDHMTLTIPKCFLENSQAENTLQQT